MDLLKLLPILFVAAQGEARAIHQQLLPAIPGYVPVYIQEGPDVQVVYETARKVAVHDSETEVKPVVEKTGEEIQPQKAVVEDQQTDKDSGTKESEQSSAVVQSEEHPQGSVKPTEDTKPEDDKKSEGGEEHKPDADEKNRVVEVGDLRNFQASYNSKDVGSGSAVLVPGYQTSDA